MSLNQDLRTHLGEREFLDYPLFLEAGSGERGLVLRRALIAAVGAALVAITVIATIQYQ
jgi:hypothetical protein